MAVMESKRRDALAAATVLIDVDVDENLPTPTTATLQHHNNQDSSDGFTQNHSYQMVDDMIEGLLDEGMCSDMDNSAGAVSSISATTFSSLSSSSPSPPPHKRIRNNVLVKYSQQAINAPGDPLSSVFFTPPDSRPQSCCISSSSSTANDSRNSNISMSSIWPNNSPLIDRSIDWMAAWVLMGPLLFLSKHGIVYRCSFGRVYFFRPKLWWLVVVTARECSYVSVGEEEGTNQHISTTWHQRSPLYPPFFLPAMSTLERIDIFFPRSFPIKFPMHF